MTYYGIIETYNPVNGTGMIQPNSGGPPLSFRKTDLKQWETEPCWSESFGFQTYLTDEGLNTAVHLCRLWIMP